MICSKRWLLNLDLLDVDSTEVMRWASGSWNFPGSEGPSSTADFWRTSASSTKLKPPVTEETSASHPVSAAKIGLSHSQVENDFPRRICGPIADDPLKAFECVKQKYDPQRLS